MSLMLFVRVFVPWPPSLVTAVSLMCGVSCTPVFLPRLGCPFSWLHCVSLCEILPCPFSDHSAVSLKVSIPLPLPHGPGRWKLNASILRDVDFISSLDRFWKPWKLRKATFSSLQASWDSGKEHIKGLAIRFSCAKNRDFLSSRSLLFFGVLFKGSY